LPFLGAHDEFIRWSTDGRSLLVFNGATLPALVERVDSASGRRAVVLRLAPADLTGVLSIGDIVLKEDASAYVFSWDQQRSSLFLLTGAR
jgi:hypothetical protein